MKQIFFGLFLLPLMLTAQVSMKDSTIQMGLMQVSYRGLIPGADMAERYGFNSQLGLDLSWKFASNFYFSLGGHALFSESIRDTTILSNLMTNGLLITDNGLITEPRMIESGFVIPFSVGKVFSFLPAPNPNCGFYVELGGQFIRHKININTPEDEVSAISGEYAKGYDRLAYGFGIREEIGYRFLSNYNGANLSLGFEFSQNFTKGRRSLHFDTGIPGNENRLDLLSGFHVSWIFPIFERAPLPAYYR